MFRQTLRIGLLVCLAFLPLAVSDGYAAVPIPSAPPKVPPEVNVSGVWQSRDWEPCWLRQDGANLSGQLGDYQVSGLVSGTDITMYLTYHGRVYHTLKLALNPPSQLIGYYYYGLQADADMQPGSHARRYLTTFVKVSDAVPPK